MFTLTAEVLSITFRSLKKITEITIWKTKRENETKRGKKRQLKKNYICRSRKLITNKKI